MCTTLPSKDDAKRELATLFQDWDGHAKRGRDLIGRLKTLTSNLEPMALLPSATLQAIFLDGFTMLVTVVSEVKFFEIKLAEHAPRYNRATVRSKIRYHG